MTKVIGLTGPMGAGKDTVAKILKRRGAEIIDADEIGHQLLSLQTEAWRKIVQEFGVKVLRTGGKINRPKLAEKVFKDPSQLEKLNQIMHPLMVKEIVKLLDQAEEENKKLVVINAAMLEKMGLIPFVDEVWVVLAPLALRIKWLEKKGYTKKEIFLRMKAQPKVKGYRKVADVVINNNGTLKLLKNRVIKLF